MDADPKIKRSIIDKNKLPALFPTHRHSAQFWEHLGRAVATFGFLEEVLGKAIFAFTATRRYNSEEEAEAAYREWLPKLERALTDQLWSLAESYEKAAREHSDLTTENVGELVKYIKEATKIRNVLCHGSWSVLDEDGKSLPLFINKSDKIFGARIDIAFLQQVQLHVAELACEVVNTVTHIGWQFPGDTGPGKTI